jgi:hypothetical protein
MFTQTGKIADYVFPLVKAKRNAAGHYDYEELIGTGFIIGQGGFALTAAHVIEQCFDDLKDDGVIIALFWGGAGWYVSEIHIHEKHPTEDVGIIKLSPGNWKSIMTISDEPEYSACEYQCWGYPHETAKEVQQLYQDVIERPDLIFTQGYVRRRITRELYPTMIFRGTQFYELSEQVGGGNSGAPVVLKKSIGQEYWKVLGIYIGEKVNGNISYAVRSESFYSWVPNILQKSILEESENVV